MRRQTNVNESLSYSESGVNIDAGNELVERIRRAARETFRPGVLQGLGGFGALFEIPAQHYKNPVLVSATDGVGTKLKLASMLNRHDTIGIDLVAMCVNDIIVYGAEPLYFLDYYATGKLQPEQAETVVRGIAQGCLQAGCALTGGETAEMPGMYQSGDYDLAGFAVGIVEKDKIITPERVKAGDLILGLASTGIHSNGYSLVRKIVEVTRSDLSQTFEDTSLGEKLLTPTRIYVKSILTLLESVRVTAICHITGGGILENLPRVLPQGVSAKISKSSWPLPALFQWLQEKGKIEETEMYRTFNCGIGMVICVDPKDADAAIAGLEKSGEQVHTLGEINASEHTEVVWHH
ncbi:phosphoribosylformylglycinamidine cyclo-ligase [Candidatus Spongiihabitans sp.]|uniref:phosphoribosylformylglycinamidine cyclo-ligase n=1 Tax=Candidatus Spongiihabitans sp. TaxID=3101308 RepID=UPI003C6F1078